MNSIRNFRTALLIVVISAIGIINKEKIESNDFLASIGLEDYKGLVILVTTIIFGFVVTPLFLWLFNNYIWKFFFPKINFNGTWEYENAYKESPGVTSKPGRIKIVQLPSEISMNEGESDAESTKASYNAKVYSISGKLFPDSEKLIFAYEVMRIGDDDVWHFTKRSIEELTVTKRNSFGRPIELRGRFWNCKRTASEITELEKGGIEDGWPAAVGKSKYKRV